MSIEISVEKSSKFQRNSNKLHITLLKHKRSNRRGGYQHSLFALKCNPNAIKERKAVAAQRLFKYLQATWYDSVTPTQLCPQASV